MIRKTVFIFLAASTFGVFATDSAAKEKLILKPEKKADWRGNVLAFHGEGIMQVKGNVTAFTKKYFPVVKGKVYKINLELGESSGPGMVTFGYVCYDKADKVILPSQVNVVPGSDTELALPCSFSDEKIIVKDGSKWKKGSQVCAAFDTKSDRSDLPNRNHSRTGISEVKKLANGTWEISFNEEIGKEYSAGTGVRQHQSGATYDYFYRAPVSSKGFKTCYLRSSFRPGTEKIGLLLFVSGAQNSNLQIVDISIEEYRK